MSEKHILQRINWTNTLFITITPVVAIAGTAWWIASGSFNWATVIFAVAMLYATGMSITAGYHRLFSHRSYTASKPVEWFFMLFGSASFEGTIIDWCADHRVHHRFQDKEEDPYAIHKGFWYAHVGWLFLKNWKAEEGKGVKDLWANPLLKWQHENYILIASVMCFGFPMAVAALWGDALGGLFIAGALRLVLNHHFTWFINSLCHYVGAQPYSDKHTSRDNWFTALFTYGEGYHNFHHEFPGDYRNGIRWFDYDPTKWLIYGLSKIGMANGLHVVAPERIIERKIQMQEVRLTRKLAKKSPAVVTFAHETIASAKARFQAASERLADIREQYHELQSKKDEAIAHQVEEMRVKFHEAQREFYQTVAMWKAMAQGLGKLA
jgi:stearoyl-CoA desaturase (delta-9 desaturase)